MDRWDEKAVDAAVAGLARTAGANEVFELFARYGARDFRDIGHKAIFVANSWRTLSCIGWQYAEPVLRSLAYALQDRGGDGPPDSDAPADRPWKQNIELAHQIRAEWQEGKPEDSATSEMLADIAHCQRSRVAAASGGTAQPRRGTAVDLGCAAGRGGRAAWPIAGHRGAARGDQQQRPAFRL